MQLVQTHGLRLRKTAVFVATMLPEHRRLVTIGTCVSAAATYFDEPHGPRWSQEVFGDQWATARISGIVIRKVRSGWRVRFEDGDETDLPLEHLELDGESLSRARTQSLAPNTDIDAPAGPSRPSCHPPGDDIDCTDSDSSLDTARVEQLVRAAAAAKGAVLITPATHSATANPMLFSLYYHPYATRTLKDWIGSKRTGRPRGESTRRPTGPRGRWRTCSRGRRRQRQPPNVPPIVPQGPHIAQRSVYWP